MPLGTLAIMVNVCYRDSRLWGQGYKDSGSGRGSTLECPGDGSLGGILGFS